MRIEGPFSFRKVDGMKTPVYIFAPGGVRMEIGEATVHLPMGGGMTFDVQLDEPYKDVRSACFDVPMRFSVMPNEEPD